MSEQPKKAEPIKTDWQMFMQASEEVRENFKPQSDRPISEMLNEQMRLYYQLKKENEARKSPEQRAREASEQEAQWARDREERARKKAEKKTQFLMALYGKYAPIDSWKLLGEAVPLLCGEEPESLLFISSEIRRIRMIAERAVLAKTLRVINPAASPDQWLVVPSEFHVWAVAKKLQIPREFEVAFGLVQAAQEQASESRPPVQGRTGSANQTRARSKAKRRARVKEFRAWIDANAGAHGYLWRHSNIPDTKQSAHRVFFALYPEIVEIAPTTLADDLHEEGIRFDNASKSMKNNVLEYLFKHSKKAK